MSGSEGLVLCLGAHKAAETGGEGELLPTSAEGGFTPEQQLHVVPWRAQLSLWSYRSDVLNFRSELGLSLPGSVKQEKVAQLWNSQDCAKTRVQLCCNGMGFGVRIFSVV